MARQIPSTVSGIRIRRRRDRGTLGSSTRVSGVSIAGFGRSGIAFIPNSWTKPFSPAPTVTDLGGTVKTELNGSVLSCDRGEYAAFRSHGPTGHQIGSPRFTET